jgi:predicted O-linked N-acetylglucosamine transferase (SPINDLY family)
MEIHANLPLNDFLALVASVDIALDPFPYNGGTTSMHTLWLGVPLVSLSSAEEVGRVSYGLLLSVGLSHLCASDSAAYVDAAADLAGNLEELAFLRSDLRRRMQGSLVMKGAEMAANLEKAYILMWHNHLEGNKLRVSI